MKQVNFLIKPASSLCNMRCRYCFYADAEQHRRPREEVCMTGETVQRLVEAAGRVLDDGGDAGFAFQGGEPTLQPLEFYESFARACEPLRRRGIRLHLAMQTNGYALTPEWAEFLAREHVLTGVSVDGTGQLHDRYRPDAGGNGTYARVTEHVRMLIRRGVQPKVISERLGHASIKITMDLYGYLMPGLQDSVADIFDQEHPVEDPAAASGS